MTSQEARDELAEVIHAHRLIGVSGFGIEYVRCACGPEWNPAAWHAQHVTDALVAAGYRKHPDPATTGSCWDEAPRLIVAVGECEPMPQRCTLLAGHLGAHRDGDTEWITGKHATPESADEVAAMVRDMVDPDDCWFDHNGGCQAHGYLSLQPGELCPQAEAKAWLDSLAVPVGEGKQE